MSRLVLDCVELAMDSVRVAIWPDGVWCSLDEQRDFEDLLHIKSDDYVVVDVDEWDEDGSPAGKYFY